MEMPETNDDSDTLDQCMLLTNVNEDETNATCDWNLFTYDNGISLQLITMADPVTMVPVLIFNAALSCDLLARQAVGANSSHHHFEQAKQLYAMAHTASDIKKNPLFHFVVANNAAVMERRLDGDLETWNSNIQSLKSQFAVLVDQGCPRRLRQIGGFIMNIFPTILSAPAA